MATPNDQLTVVPQRRSGKTEASMKLTEKLLREHPQLHVECVGLAATEMVEKLPEDLQVRAFPTAPRTRTVVDELQDELYPPVRDWVAEKPGEVTIPAFFQRFPEFENTPLLQQALIPILGQYNPAYFSSGKRWMSEELIMVDEVQFVPPDAVEKLIGRLQQSNIKFHFVGANADQLNAAMQAKDSN